MPMIEDMSVQDTVDRRMQSIKKSPGIFPTLIIIMLTFHFLWTWNMLVNQYVIEY